MKVSATPPSPISVGTPCLDQAAATKSSAFFSPATTASSTTTTTSCSSAAAFSPVVVVSPPTVFDRRRMPHRCSNASSSVSSGGVTASSSSSSWSSAGSSSAGNAAGDDWLQLRPEHGSDDDDGVNDAATTVAAAAAAAAAAPAASAANACCLGVELINLAESHELRSVEEAARRSLRTGIARAVREVWTGCSVRCYGSFTYGLSTAGSPLDVVVEGCDNLEQRFHSVLAPLRGVVSVRRIMQEGAEAMLRATCVATGTCVNITLFQSAERSQPRATAAFVRAQVRRFPALRSVVACVRALLRADGVRCFTTYHLVLMALRVCEEADDARDPGALLVDFLDLYGQRLRLEQPAAAAASASASAGEVCGDDAAAAIVLRDPVTGANVASSLSLLDAHRLKVSLRARLHALHHFVEGKSSASCAFEAIMGYCTNQA